MSLVRRRLPYLSIYKERNSYSIDHFGLEHFEILTNTNKLWVFEYNPITTKWIRYEDGTYGTYKISDKDLINLNLQRTELILKELSSQFIIFKIFLLQNYPEVGDDLYVNICKLL